MPYGTMTLDEIAEIQIDKVADSNCNLFCWTTHTFLPATFEIIKGWGFKYHCTLTWNKGNGRPHFGFKRNTEFVVYAYKGKITVKQRGQFIKTLIDDSIPDLFHERLTVHSRKPTIFYKILENNTPSPRLEIFARNKRAGWDVFGNEVESDIQLIGEKVL
jgi:N6-adenosine-specific RNA methylase IME4